MPARSARRRAAPAYILVGVIGAGACGTLEPPAVAPADTPRHLRAERPAATEEGTELRRAVAGRPLSLEVALALAERLSPALRALEGEVAAARARALQAGLYPNPTLDAGIEDWPPRAGVGEADVVAGVTQPLVLGGRLRAAEAAAGKAREAAEADLALARRAVRAEVRAAFAAALFWRDRAALSAELVRVARESVTLAAARFKAGDVPESELLKAEVEQARAEIERERAESERRGALARLAARLGDATVEVGDVAGTLPAAGAPAVSLADLGRRTLEGYPGIAALTRRFERARLELALARASAIPDLEVRLGGGRLGERGEGSIEAGVAIALPLFDRAEGRIAEAEAGIARAAREAEAGASAALAALAEAHRAHALARSQAARYEAEILPRAVRALEQTRAAYRAGGVSLLEVLDAQRTLGETRALELEARRDLAVAEAELKRFAGE